MTEPSTPSEPRQPYYPGLFAGIDDEREAQRVARKFWQSYRLDGELLGVDRVKQLVEDEREIRYRKIIASAALCLGLWFPLAWTGAYVLFTVLVLNR